MKKLIATLCTLLTLGLSVAVSSPARAGANTVDQFIIDCKYANERAAVDPIKSFGAVSAHSHDFFGRGDITSTSTPDSLAGRSPAISEASNELKTNCSGTSDTSGYWFPTMYHNGVPVNAIDFHTYWRRGDFPCTPPNCGGSNAVGAWPQGVGYVAGISSATAPQDMNRVFWDCGANSTTTSQHSTNPYWCGNPTLNNGKGYTQSGGLDGVTAVIRFPQCWNGQLATPVGEPYDMTQDFAYPTTKGVCPNGFATKIERLEEHIHFGIWDPCYGARPCDPNASATSATIQDLQITLSSGSQTPYPGTSLFSLHADAMNGWDTQQELIDVTNKCLNGSLICAGQQP